MAPFRVLIVDDSPVYRKILKLAIGEVKKDAVMDCAENGNVAIEKVKAAAFEAVLLDVNMPDPDGLQTLVHLKAIRPNLPVIMLSGSGSGISKITMEALTKGAMDFIVKPLEEDYEKNLQIISGNLKGLFTQIEQNREKESKIKIFSGSNEGRNGMSGAELIVVASSTGGPVALDVFFKNLPRDLNIPILVVQHMPPDFTFHLAQSLNKITHYEVLEGRKGMPVEKGKAYIAPGGYHMKVGKGLGGGKILMLDQESEPSHVRPAADILFRSVAREYSGEKVIAVVLTGMGNDGTEGVREMKKTCVTYTICQNEESCVVYGMPRRVYEEGLGDELVDIAKISQRIGRILSRQDE